MPTGSLASIQGCWLTYLMDMELAKNYKMANVIAGLGHPAPNPILEQLLPSLLYVRLGAFLDETFEEYVTANGLVMSTRYRSDFNGRITFLNDQARLKDAAKLHALRVKRNGLAHEATKSCTWAELEDATTVADSELQHLGLVGPSPKYEFYAERKPRNQPEPGYVMTFDYCYGLKFGEKKAVEVSWTVNHGGIGKE
jgi:hypothetical protein